MEEIIFNTPGMLAVGGELQGLYSTLQSLADNISTTGDMLSTVWQGAASENFHHTLLLLLANMRQFHLFAESLAAQFGINAGTMAAVDVALSARWL